MAVTKTKQRKKKRKKEARKAAAAVKNEKKDEHVETECEAKVIEDIPLVPKSKETFQLQSFSYTLIHR